ncbi:MAG: DUF1553 domain-containing protein [Planctomycetia bacterium]|nr:DUF1553 domain-containing protein [Planctomycetia bacterium]
MCAAAPARAADEAAAPELLHDVLPLLRARCVKCHGPMKHEAELNLGTPRSIARGGDQGAPVVAGKPDESLLWQRVEADEMPPESPLMDEEKELLRRWVASGAAGLPTAEEAAKPGPDHWAFVPPARPQPPEVAHAERVGNEVDRFLLAALERRGLGFAPEADRATLARRVSFDLTGLPPAPDEVAAYLADETEGAYRRMVERCLASPRYGERWGQHWLDAAGYADSNGYFNADSVRPLAYRYRDYVIGAVNADKPFDRFIQEQLAGDEMAGYEPGGDVTPDTAALLVATHLLRNAPDGTGESDGNPDELRVDRFAVLEGTVQIVASSMLGLTVQCARCHDHKFEPVTQEEYYGLQAIFWPSYCPDKWRKPAERTTSIATRAEREEHARLTKEIDEKIKGLKDALAELADPVRKDLVEEKLAKLDEPLQSQLREALGRKNKKQTDADRELIKAHEKELAVTDDDVAAKSAEYNQARAKTNEEVSGLERQRPRPLEQIALLWEVQSPAEPHHLLVRGDYRAPGPEVGPSVPRSLLSGGMQYKAEKAPGRGSGRRTALARWITDSRHPLLARITVNRIWQHHFGRGIVTTADNFGYTGAIPTHPELLDYLATEFIAGGWSVKAVHRLILNSSAYRQSSTASESAGRADPDNVLLSRFPLLRLDAEGIRDAMLRTSGELDLAGGGPFVPTMRQEDGEVIVEEKLSGACRRSIFLQRRRTQINTMLDVFDAPQVVTNCTRRNTSTIATQSLSLLNSQFVTARAKAMADRLAREAGDDPGARIAHAFLLAYGRAPRAAERAAAEAFVAAQPAAYASQADAQQRAWQDLCQMLLASNAFLYIE